MLQQRAILPKWDSSCKNKVIHSNWKCFSYHLSEVHVNHFSQLEFSSLFLKEAYKHVRKKKTNPQTKNPNNGDQDFAKEKMKLKKIIYIYI